MYQSMYQYYIKIESENFSLISIQVRSSLLTIASNLNCKSFFQYTLYVKHEMAKKF